jgi:hypothetical protein
MSQQISNKSMENNNKKYYSKTCGGNSETCQDDGITNYGGNLETCQDNIIAMLYMNIVFISYTKTMFIYAIVQMTIIDLVALGCIPWHSVAFQGTRLHSKAFGYITRHSTPFLGTQLRLG